MLEIPHPSNKAMPKHKPDRSPNAWTKDIQVLTCLLRLRCQPPVPYTLISSLLLQTRPSLIARLSSKVAPKDVTPEPGLQEWLEGYLKDIFEKGEEWESEAWKVAREWKVEGVREIVRGAGLERRDGDGDGIGFVVMEEEELECQIRWRREGDWKAGSTPLGKPTRLDVDEYQHGPIAAPVPIPASMDFQDDLSSFHQVQRPWQLLSPSPLPVIASTYLEDDLSSLHQFEWPSLLPSTPPPQVQRKELRRWRRTVGTQRQQQPADPMTFPSSRDVEEEVKEFGPPGSLTTPVDSGAVDVCSKPFGYFGDQGWTEMAT